MIKSLPNLLIVDDNQSNLILLEIILGKSPVNLIKAESGFEALDKSKGMELALAILDIQMPGMNGFELAVKINEERGEAKVPVIFLTANYFNQTEVYEGYNSGAVDYIFKPVNNLILLSKINVFLDLFNQKKIIIQDAELLKKKSDELIRINSDLKKSKEKYTELYDFAPSGYFTLTKDGEIIGLNLSAANMLGKECASLQNSQFDFFVSNDTKPIFNLFLDKVFASNDKETCEVSLSTNGVPPMYVHLSGVVTENGGGIMITMIDITERKQTETKLIKSEERYKRILTGITDYVYTVKVKDGKAAEAIHNEACLTVTGYSRDEFKADPYLWINMVVPEERESVIKRFSEILEGKDLPPFEHRIVCKDGKIRWINDTTILHFDSNGALIYYDGIIKDITERKLAEQALRVSEEKYKTLLNASPDGILLIDLIGTITEVSEIGLELFGANTRDDLVGKDFSQFIPPDESNNFIEIIEKTISEGLVQNVETKIKKINQSLFAGETSATLIQDTEGAPISFMIIIRDISQRKKLETKQVHADRMANLGEMASGIAHEINQPLNIISMVMDKVLFESAKTDSIDIEFLRTKSDKIFENITRIKNIIDHIRAFSRSHDDYVLAAFDINSSIENATSMIIEQFKYLGIELNLQLERHIPQIFGNTYRFEQVIINLLVNAKDAVIEKRNKRGKDFEMIVGIKSYLENQFLIIEVTDNGMGISDDDIHNIILPFYTTKDEGKGTGLGLSICYQIIKEMNGSIDITSDRFFDTKVKIVLDYQKKK